MTDYERVSLIECITVYLKGLAMWFMAIARVAAAYMPGLNQEQ